MILQKFEAVPDERRLTMMVDLLRYENAAQSAQVDTLEREIANLRAKLDHAESALDDLQQVIDLQNARWFAARQSKA